MVIGDNDIDTERFCLFNRFARVGPAIDGDDQRWAVLFNTSRQRVGGKAVAIVETIGNKCGDLAAQRAQNPDQQCGGANAVGIVVAEHGDFFAVTQRAPNPLNRLVHIRQLKRVAQRAQTTVN